MNKSLIYAALVAVFSGSATARMADSSSVSVPELVGRGCSGQNQDSVGRSNSTGDLVGRAGYGRGDVVGRSTGDAQEMKREVVTEKRDASSLKTIEVAGRNKYGKNCGGSTQTALVQASTAPSPTTQQQQSSFGGGSGSGTGTTTTTGTTGTGTTTTGNKTKAASLQIVIGQSAAGAATVLDAAKAGNPYYVPGTTSPIYGGIAAAMASPTPAPAPKSTKKK